MKAFDKVPHHRLLHKLEFYGIRGSLHSWISSFLGNRSQQVLLDGVTSSTAPVQLGLTQGSVLGPLLFVLFINDLPEYISPKSTARLFADDCILCRTIETESDARDLQLDLDRLQQWKKDWLMEFHPQKCQVLHITSKRKSVKFLLRSAMADLYKLQSKHTSNSGFDQTFMPCSGYISFADEQPNIVG